MLTEEERINDWWCSRSMDEKFLIAVKAMRLFDESRRLFCNRPMRYYDSTAVWDSLTPEHKAEIYRNSDFIEM